MLKTNKKIKIQIPKTNRLGLNVGDNVAKILFAEIESVEFAVKGSKTFLNASGRYFYKDNASDENKVNLNGFSFSLDQSDMRSYFEKFSFVSTNFDEIVFEMLYYVLKNIMIEDSEGILLDGDIDIVADSGK